MMGARLVEIAAECIVREGDRISIATIAPLEAALTSAFGDSGLPEEVRELVSFALYLGEAHGAEDVARSLLETACLATPVLERRCANAHEAARREEERARTQLGIERLRLAPKYGERAPVGTIAINAILSDLPGKRRA